MAIALAEIPGPHPRHAQPGHPRHLVKAHLEELAGDDGVQVGVVGAGSVPGLEEGEGLVQIVNDRRVIVPEHAVDGLRQLLGLLVGVAVGVHEDVSPPVGWRLAGQAVVVGLAFQVAVEPVHHFGSPIGVRNRIDEHHHPFADPADHRLLGDRQPVGELQDRFRAARLIGVETGIDVEDRSRPGDDLFGAPHIGLSGIGQGGGRRLELRQGADALLIRHRDEQNLSSLLGPPDGFEKHPRRGLCERLQIAGNLLHPGQLTGRTHDSTKVFGRRGNPVGLGHIRDPWADKSRIGGESCDGLH